MTLRAAYIECTGALWVSVAGAMKRDCDWRPVFWSAAAESDAAVRSSFPDVTFQENTDAVKGRFGDWMAEEDLPAFDEKLHRAFAYEETIAIRMMDRVDPDESFAYLDRIRLFQRHVRIGLAALRRFRPDVAIFAAAPHLVYDYVFYVLCRHLGIATVVFAETAVDGIVFSSDSFESSCDVPGEAADALVRSNVEPVLSASFDAYLTRTRGSYEEAEPKYMAELLGYQPGGPATQTPESRERERLADIATRYRNATSIPAGTRTSDGRRSLRSKIALGVRLLRAGIARVLLRVVSPSDHRALEALRDLDSMLARTRPGDEQALADALDCTSHLYRAIEGEYPLRFRSTDPSPVSYLRPYAHAPEDGDLSYLEYWLYRLLALRKKRAMRRAYDASVSKLDLERPFIYVPLQYQPEVTTSPMAGVFVDQESTITQLSAAAPAGWLVIVKEHRFTFDKKGSGELCRRVDFYDRVARLPNVRIAPLDTPPFQLIDKARAIATATGTSGWEALLRGKPVLLFGHSWYLRCDGAFDARDLERCRQTLERIASGYRPDPRKIRAFMQALEQVGFRGYTIPDLAADSGVAADSNEDGFVRDLKRHDAHIRRTARMNEREDMTNR